MVLAPSRTKTTGLAFKSRDYIGSVEPPATVLEDKSRWGNNGAFLGDGQPDLVQLPSGLWVMRFDGSNDTVTFAPAITLSQGSISFWVYWDVKPSDAVADDRPFNGIFGARINDHLYIVGTSKYFVGATIVAKIWLHYVFTWTDNTDSDTVIMYKDCVALVQGGPAPANWDGLSTLGHATECFQGDIALLKVWNYVLSAEQIADIFEKERHYFGV